jgi:hypothetical protein
METLTIRELTSSAKNIGRFVTSRLIGGAWAELAEIVTEQEDAQ